MPDLALQVGHLTNQYDLREKLAAIKAWCIAAADRECNYEVGIDLEDCLLHQSIDKTASILTSGVASQLKTYDGPIPSAELIVAEGAQGVLIDEWHGFHPYTTWSDVTATRAKELLSGTNITEICVMGITRSYMTRHGAGPLPTEIPAIIHDPNNPPNHWQGTMRAGYLDMELLRYSNRVCKVDCLAINHLDVYMDKICHKYADNKPLQPTGKGRCLQAQQEITNFLMNPEECIPQYISTEKANVQEMLREIAPIAVTGYGNSRLHRHIFDIPWRNW
jgi:adenylosuccinate synthase